MITYQENVSSLVKKDLENKEFNEQLTTFSYLIIDMGIFTGIIAS